MKFGHVSGSSMEVFEDKSQQINNSNLQDFGYIMQKKIPEQFDRILSVINENERLWDVWKFRNDKMMSIVNETKCLWEFTTNMAKNWSTGNCEQCPRLVTRIKECEQELKTKDNIISDLSKAIPKDHDSFQTFTQKVADIMKATKMLPTLEDLEIENKSACVISDIDGSVIMKTPESCRKHSELEMSPVVVKRSRNNKRRLMRLSSKKNKTENGDGIVNTDLDFPELEVIKYNPKAEQQAQDVENYITPLDPVDDFDKTIIERSPEVRRRLPNVASESTEPSQKTSNYYMEIKRSLSFVPSKPNLNGTTVEGYDVKKSPPIEAAKLGTKKALKTLNVDFVSNDNNSNSNKTEFSVKSPENYKKVFFDDSDKTKDKTKWNLTKSREPTNDKKLKQTLLSTMSFEKRVDISTLDTFNGGSIPTEARCQKVENNEKNPDKENSNETFFDPVIMSTENDQIEYTKKIPIKSSKLWGIAENSFDFIPNTSPDYKYKRNAVRKQSKRRKLPGQECDKCFNFYEQQRAELGETQVLKILDKCSRHRDKFAIQSNTPPGFWNPVFDTDEEINK